MSFEKPKKYVFHLTQENARYFQDMEQDQRHSIINKIIEKHFNNKKPKLSENLKLKFYLKRIGLAFVVIFVVIPILFWIIRVAVTSTKANYDYFTHGFVKYEQSQKNKR